MHASTPFRARRLRHVLIAAALLVALLPSPTPAYAATFTVDTREDFIGTCGSAFPGLCTLRTAVLQANSTSAQDTINVPAGVFNLTALFEEELEITKDVVINGAGVGKTIIDAGGRSRVIRVDPPANVTIHDLTIRGGDAENSSNDNGEGGGIFNDGTLTLERVVVTGNTAFLGGGIWNDSGASLTLREVSIQRNIATIDAGDAGGGIYNEGTMVLDKVTIDRNRAGGAGGGIFNEQNAQATLTDVIISRNVTDRRSGGGISNEAIKELTLDRVSIFGNKASGAGGGIRNSGTLSLTNVTISGNSVRRKETFIPGGGGLRNSGYATLTNVTIAKNSAVRGSGISNRDPDDPDPDGVSELKNVVIANNGVNCFAAVTSLGGNLENGSSCGLGPSDLINVNPKVAGLKNNGGFTPTHALQSKSPAIDAGIDSGCPSTDQRGEPRVNIPGMGTTTCDIGAFEFQP